MLGLVRNLNIRRTIKGKNHGPDSTRFPHRSGWGGACVPQRIEPRIVVYLLILLGLGIPDDARCRNQIPVCGRRVSTQHHDAGVPSPNTIKR